MNVLTGSLPALFVAGRFHRPKMIFYRIARGACGTPARPDADHVDLPSLVNVIREGKTYHENDKRLRGGIRPVAHEHA
jgi:hypothetical protein